MKIQRLGIFAVCAATLALAACATSGPTVPTGGVQNPPPIVVAQATVVDEKALFAVEAAYNVAATAYVSADGRGQLTPAIKARVKPVLERSYAALRLARSAYSVGDAATFTAQATAAAQFAAQAGDLLPTQGPRP